MCLYLAKSREELKRRFLLTIVRNEVISKTLLLKLYDYFILTFFRLISIFKFIGFPFGGYLVGIVGFQWVGVMVAGICLLYAPLLIFLRSPTSAKPLDEQLVSDSVYAVCI